MRGKFFLIVVVVMLFIFSCNSKTNSSNASAEEPKTYFDLKNYFLQQAKILSASNCGLNKKITKDGKTEEKLLSAIDWQKELKPFSDGDINKPAWLHSYLIYTNFSGTSMNVKYVARDSALSIREIKLTFENNQVLQIHIRKQSTNSYYTANNDYVFQPDYGFTITGLQEVMLADKTVYSIVAKFVR